MPEVNLQLEWPDGRLSELYSPSTVILEHLRPGDQLAVGELTARACTALRLASERVRARYGFACTRADEEERDLLALAQGYGADQIVVVAAR